MGFSFGFLLGVERKTFELPKHLMVIVLTSKFLTLNNIMKYNFAKWKMENLKKYYNFPVN